MIDKDSLRPVRRAVYLTTDQWLDVIKVLRARYSESLVAERIESQLRDSLKEQNRDNVQAIADLYCGE